MGRPHKLGATSDEIAERLHNELGDQLTALQNGDGWKAWLTLASRLPSYSFHNQLLIMAQNPDATMVAPFRFWKRLGRSVRKGEQSLKIWAPVTRRIADDDDTATEDVKGGKRIVGFRVVSTFDVSQTDGDPLPTPPHVALLPGQAPAGMWDSLAAMVADKGFTLTRAASKAEIGGANGVTNFGTKTVTVRADVDDAQAVKTLAHELGHILLHDPAGDGQQSTLQCRGTVEVEAESFAYIVSAHHGLDTGDYTFGYIAGWAASAGDDPATAIERTGRRVVKAAGGVIEAMDSTEILQAEVIADTDAHVVASEQLLGRAETVAATLGTSKSEAVAPAVAAVADVAPTSGQVDLDALYRCASDAQDWFVRNGAGAEPWNQAVLQRGLDFIDAETFGIGWGGERWTSLVDELRRLGHSDAALQELGLAVEGKHGLIDAFRNRVTFPYITPDGKITGFTGRLAVPSQGNLPKYLNSPTSRIFSKREGLIGWHAVSPATTRLVVVEGPWDAIAVTAGTRSESVGISTNGTALTMRHAEQLRAAGLPIVVWTDPDAAGQAASVSAYRTLKAAGVERPHRATVDIVDPSEYHRMFGQAGVQSALGHTSLLVNALVESELPVQASAQEAVAAARRIGAMMPDMDPTERMVVATRINAITGIETTSATEALMEGWERGKGGPVAVTIATDGGGRGAVGQHAASVMRITQ